jgi:hypothetical protein
MLKTVTKLKTITQFKMSTPLKKALFAGIFVVLPLTAAAERCDKILVQNTLGFPPEDAKTLASYQLIDKDLFQKIKKDGEKGTAGGAAFYLFRPDFDQSNNYSDFNEKRNQRLFKYQYKNDQSYSRDILRLFLGPTKTEAWRKCKLSAAGGESIIIEIQEVSAGPKSIAAVFHFNPLTETSESEIEIELKDATIRKKNTLKLELTGSTSEPYIIKLDPNAAEATIVARFGGNSDSMRLMLREKTYKAPNPPEKVEFIPPKNSLPFRFYVCTGKQKDCISLTRPNAESYVPVPGLSENQFISGISNDYNLGTLEVGTAKMFSITATPHTKAAVDCEAANLIKVKGNTEDNGEWRQEVIFYVTKGTSKNVCTPQ